MNLSSPPLRYRTVFVICLAVAVFGFIPGLGLPGILVLLMLYPFPYIVSLFDLLQGDTAWGVAVVITWITPPVAFAVYILNYALIARRLLYVNKHLLFLALLLVAWYATALSILVPYASMQIQNPRAGTMMQYLP